MVQQQLSTKARVTVTVEVMCSSTWGLRAEAQQIFDQAAVEATNHIRKLTAEDNCVQVVGDPVVTMISSVLDKQ